MRFECPRQSPGFVRVVVFARVYMRFFGRSLYSFCGFMKDERKKGSIVSMVDVL